MDPSSVKAFSEQYGLKTSVDECKEVIIQGKQGHVYQYSDSLLGVMFMPTGHRPRLWGSFKESAEATGMYLIQNGDSEGCLAFDPESKEQVTLALKIAKIRRRKQLTPERRAELSALLAKARNSRSNPSVEGHLSG